MNIRVERKVFHLFNPIQKNEFIEDFLSKSETKNIEKREIEIEKFFNRLEEVESDLEKDFSLFDYEEIILALSVICRRGARYQKTILSQLRQYLEWCIDKGYSLDNENRLIGLTIYDIDLSLSYKMGMIKDEEHLVKLLNMELNSLEEDTIDNMYRCLLHLVFNGLTFDEALNLKQDMVDLKNELINLPQRTINISDVCCHIIKYVTNMDYYSSNVGYDSQREFKIVKTGYVLERTTANRESMKKSIIPVISNHFRNIKKEMGHKISITLFGLHLSGILYRIYQKEQNNEKLDFNEYVGQNLNSNINIATPQQVIDNGLVEYSAWKKAFDL